MIFKFTQFQELHKSMRATKEERATFPIEYNSKSFSCIFITDIIPYRFYLTTLGEEPITFEFEIQNGYSTKCHIDDYYALLKYLELKFDPNNKFTPIKFFEAINEKIPSTFSQRPHYTTALKVTANRRAIEEIEQIFFCGWRKNPTLSHVSDKNY